MPPDDSHVNGHVIRYVDARFADHDKQHQAEHRALDAASASVNLRLAGMNEFRESLNDASRTFVTRDVLDITVRERNQRIDAVANETKARLDAMRTEAQRAAIAAGVVGVISGVILAILLAEVIRP